MNYSHLLVHTSDGCMDKIAEVISVSNAFVNKTFQCNLCDETVKKIDESRIIFGVGMSQLFELFPEVEYNEATDSDLTCHIPRKVEEPVFFLGYARCSDTWDGEQ